jgi:hypothetical protein
MRLLKRPLLLLCLTALSASISGADRVSVPPSGPEALSGIWMPDSAPRVLLTSSGKTPPLTVEAAKLYAERRQRFARGDAAYDPTSWCAGPGMPRILTMQYPFEIRADANRIAFIHGWYRWFRTVDMGTGAAPLVGVPVVATITTDANNQGTVGLVIGGTTLPTAPIADGTMTVENLEL